MIRVLIILTTFIGSSTLLAHGISDADKQSMIEGGYLEYISLGASHMITGYDHLLFLFGVIFFLSKFKEIVQFITVFTIGHCITLIFATFWGITANYFIIDAVIALTVIYKGFDNLEGFQKIFKMQKSPNLLALVFIFGLIHGFGLSARLQQLPLGEEGLLLKILSFNLGVELGQIVALAIMLFFLNIWRKYNSFKKFSDLSNYALCFAGAYLFCMQMYGYFTEEPEQTQSIEQVAQIETKDRSDIITVTVPPGKGLEYKFFIKKGDKFTYKWKADGVNLYYDFHGDYAIGNNFKSYEKKTATEAKGELDVDFDGSHGWYWRNDTAEEVVILLEVKGKYKILGLK